MTRFAPTPSGRLHLGHALAALVAWRMARSRGGTFMVRMEDIDRTRCRVEFEKAILDDLQWLGLTWPEPVRRQSEHLEAYGSALQQLRDLDVIYPCFCTRAEIDREVARMVRAPHHVGSAYYPGTCRGLNHAEQERQLAAGRFPAWRLDVERAAERAGPLDWHDLRYGWYRARPQLLGDVVLARKDIGTSYHLAVVVDDAEQGVTLVTRGDDLLPVTHLHRLLQSLLGLPVPAWAHHSLVRDPGGRRLAKSDRDLTLAEMREQGITPGDVIIQLGGLLREMNC